MNPRTIIGVFPVREDALCAAIRERAALGAAWQVRTVRRTVRALGCLSCVWVVVATMRARGES